MNVQTLTDLDEDEFGDELSENVHWSADNWKLFLEPEVVHRTVDALAEMLAKVTMQLNTHEGKPDADPLWEKRAQNFRTLVETRLSRAKHAAHQSEATGDRSRAWRSFAHDLAEALEDSDLSGELDDIVIPFDGLTAREWLERRRQKRAQVAA